MFERVESRGVDNLLALMEKFRADPRAQKIDLVVGVYKDDQGAVPIMRAVKAAERRLVGEETTKTYVGIAGNAEYRALVPPLLLGEDSALINEGRVGSVQTPGGTGALKVGSDLLHLLQPGNKIWMSTPTWANHIPVATDAGLKVDQYPYFRASDRGLDFDGMMSHLSVHAKAGEVILLHACCHNPTGVDLSPQQWKEVTALVEDRSLFPLVDCAYQGLGDGMEEDVAGLRYMAARVPEMLLASSFSKNFGIYRERTGALSLVCRTAEQVTTTMEAVQTVIRSNYSMPPSHGACIVATIFADAELKSDWSAELTDMRTRIADMRSALKTKLEERQVTDDLSFLTDQKGMFSYTGFTPDKVERLRNEFGIYMAKDGRINVAAIGSGNIDAVAEGFAAVLR